MAAPIPLRGDFDASQLRGLARKTKDGPQARRLLALAAIYDMTVQRATRGRRSVASDFRSSGIGCCVRSDNQDEKAYCLTQ
jgi:hypothetical protein